MISCTYKLSPIADKEKQLTKPKKYTHQCDKCKRNFNHLKHLKTHYKNNHKESTSSNSLLLKRSTKTLKCSICGFTDFSRNQIYQHFQNFHDIIITTKSMEFENNDAFTLWKTKEEKDTCSFFISEHGWYTTESYKILKYVCHRSGYYKNKGKGTRHIKTQGTKKINGFCPAGIKLTICRASGKCLVEYTKTHAGHGSNNLGHLTLTKTERESFAMKIASKIPFQTILDEVRDSVYNSELDRTHLLTKKDLHNIQQTFNLNNEAIRHTNDAVSIELWVKEVENSGCVLFYKPQDITLLEHTNLKKEDFILIVMNMGQLEMLEKFADDCICIDGTHGLNPYDFQLQTLLVLDDLREGFPCAFLFSNRSDEEILFLFFSCIKDKLGRQIKPRVFMSDMENTFYNAWVRVMEPADFRYVCMYVAINR